MKEKIQQTRVLETTTKTLRLCRMQCKLIADTKQLFLPFFDFPVFLEFLFSATAHKQNSRIRKKEKNTLHHQE